MPKIAEESIRKVVENSDIVDVIGSYISLKKAGSIFKGLCPFHKEKTPSFTVRPSHQTFHCFGCQAGGGVIRFVMDYEQIPFVDAVKKLAARSGIPVVEEQGGADDKTYHERKRLLSLHQRVANWFHQTLLSDARAATAREYLLRERGYSLEVIKAWQLGYAPAHGTTLHEIALKAGFTQDELVRGGLCGVDEERQKLYDRFRDRVMIPIHNDFGEVIAFSGRILDSATSTAKYVNSPETPIFVKGNVLFGLHKSKRSLIASGAAIVCEGQFDLITAFENGIQNVIAPQGTAFTSRQAALLKRFVQTAILCFDADTAGQNAVKKSLPSLFESGLEIRVLQLPKGQDPDSVIRSQGPDAFRSRLAESMDVIDHLVRTAKVSGQTETPAGLAAAAQEIAGFLRMIPQNVHRDAALNQAATGLQLTPAQLATLMRRLKPRNDPRDSAGEETAVETNEIPPMTESCKLLCRFLILSPAARAWLAQQTSPPLNEIGEGWEILEFLLRKENDFSSPAEFSARLSLFPPAYQSALAALDLHTPETNPEKKVADTWNGLELAWTEKQIEAAKARLGQKNLSLQESLNLQKELLDLSGRLRDVSRPHSDRP